MKISIAKRLLFFLIFMIVFFFVFKKNERLSIEGTWDAKEIIINDKKVYPNELNKYINFNQQIFISQWNKSFSIPTNKKDILVNYTDFKKVKNKYQIELKSKEKSLNGIFKIEIDTIYNGELQFKVSLKIRSKTNFLHLEKTTTIPPWKPQFPRRGQV